MLRKLTSPRTKAAQGGSAKQSATASGKKERSSLGGSVDAERKRKGEAEEAVTGEGDHKQEAAPAREELKLELNALTASTKAGSQDAESEQQDVPSVERSRTLLRSPRARKKLLDDSAEPEPPAAKEGPPSGRQQTLVRSPRVRKNLLGVESEPASGSTPRAKPSPKKRGGGLKALKGIDAKMSSSTTTASDPHEEDSTKNQRDSKLKKKSDGDNQQSTSAKDAKPKSKTKTGKAEAKALDRHEERENNEKSDSESPSDRTNESKQPAKNSLSPLRRRKLPAESSELSRPGGKLVGHRLKLRDLPPMNQPEVHIIGEITSGEGFGSGGFACKWGVELGSSWHHIAGDQLGQTQIDYPSSNCQIIWSHPIDLHLATSSFHGWPKFLLQVWQIDTHMKANVVGYGHVNLPFAAGEHELTACLWRPMGSAKEELAATLLGRTPELVSDDVVFSAAWADRCRLQTIATGKVHLQVAVLLRNFQVSSLQM